jgi:DNA-binding NarL/FixJ family response regulator
VERIKITLLHGRLLFRASLARLLAAERDFELIGECANAAEGLASLRQTSPDAAPPDVVLLDFGVWQDFIPDARAAGYPGNFLAIAEEIDAATCARALSQGVSGVFLGSDSPGRLMQAIRLVASGEVWVDRRVIQLLAERYPHHEVLRLDGLVAREQAVLRGILSGLTNRKIADQIGTSEATVKATIQHLFDKTGVRTRSQLVRILLDGETLTNNIQY